MAVTDVTDAREDAKQKDDALRQNLVLLQEVRHRVANSLQIIASVLLQNAKKTRSEETRGHLKDAHHRVMSIAALERQLAGSGDRAVELRGLFHQPLRQHRRLDDRRRRANLAGGLGDRRPGGRPGLGEPGPDRHGAGDQRPEARLPGWPVRPESWWTARSTVPTGSCRSPTTASGCRRTPSRSGWGWAPASSRPWPRSWRRTVETGPAHPGTRVAVSHTQIALVDDDAVPSLDDRAVKRPAA